MHTFSAVKFLVRRVGSERSALEMFAGAVVALGCALTIYLVAFGHR